MAVNKEKRDFQGLDLSNSLAEARFVCVLALVLLAVTSVPSAFGYLTAPTDKWFSGIVDNVHDTAQYLSWMRESAHQLFVENKLTSEP